MASIIPGYEYDIFISYRQKDNKGDRWVSEFVDALKTELESTFKEEISVYFDINPHDGLLETHDVDASLKEKLKCLIFIPIISRTYCDPKSFAWEHEFKTFVEQASQDQFGLKVKLPGGNVANRILPIQIHDLTSEDKTLLEKELGGVLRSIEFIYKEPGVDKPLAPEDNEKKNLNNTKYRIQIIKVAHAIKDIVLGLKTEHDPLMKGMPPLKELLNEEKKEDSRKEVISKGIIDQKSKKWMIILLSVFLFIAGAYAIYKIIDRSKQTQDLTKLEKSIAVLPFKSLSDDPEKQYLADGMMDAILLHLSKIEDLRVMSRTSVEQYRKTDKASNVIGQELGVAYLLEGSFQKYGDNARLIVQLIKTGKEGHVWAKDYDRNWNDVFSVQSEVAQTIARELHAEITPEEKQLIEKIPTANLTAYDFYLKGNDYWSKSEYSLALDMYSQAIQYDSLFTAAYAQRAKLHLYFYHDKLEGWEGHDLKAKEDIKKGNLLNPELPEVKLAMAVAYYYLDRDYDNALKIIEELKAEGPNMADLYFYSAAILRRQGKWEESISEYKIGIQLDPFNADNIGSLGDTYFLSHQYDKAIECVRQGLSLIPDYKGFNYGIYIYLLNKTGNFKASLKESGLKEADVQYEVYYYNRQYDKLIEFIRKEFTILTDESTYQTKTYKLALIYYLSGQKSLCKMYSDSTITYLKQKIKENPYDDRFYPPLGKCYAFNGNVNEAIDCGKKAVYLRPIKLDAYQGEIKEQDLMEIYIFTGNYELALDKIEYLLSIPGWLSVGILIADPVFDNLRSLPRFQKITENSLKQIL
jgi:TolB-like protein